MTVARPEATNARRVAIAAAIPMPPSSSQAGKNAPKSTKEGAPRDAQPLMEAASTAPNTTLVKLRFFNCDPLTVYGLARVTGARPGAYPMK
jgi:hypothetical protein